MNFHEWLITEAKTDKILVYHGTSPRHFNSIMSQGLIPDAPNRAWSDDEDTGYYSSSRKSLEGVYVTTNLLTAYSSTSNAGNRKDSSGGLLVIAKIQPKTGFMDEDDLNRFSSAAVDSEYVLSALYGAIQANPKDEFV